MRAAAPEVDPMKKPVSPLVLMPLIALGACGSNGTDAAASAPTLEQLADLALLNPSMPEPGLLCMGQPTREQFDALAEAGFRAFINLRTPGESGTGWEADEAAALGVLYTSLPVAGAADVDEAHARELAAALEQAEGPTVLYCGSSNRVGALYGLRARFVGGADPAESLARAKAAGCRGLEPRVRAVLGLE